MKKIKIKICNYDENDKYSFGYFVINILKKYYEVELSNDPDYLFYTESTYAHLNYDCIKIFYTGENISPNFNMCDYAIGFDYMSFEDRYYRLPLYLVTVFYSDEESQTAGNSYITNPKEFVQKELSQKTDFCSFVYSNYRSEKERREIFDKLSTYKKVNAGGSYLNNVGGKVKNKLAFEAKHKFSIAFENSSRSGYTTEKIAGALAARTIPIYWGNPHIDREFNGARFINCHDYSSFNAVLEKIKELDNNDDLYLAMMNQPIPAEGYNFEDIKNGFEKFLVNIINQPLDTAKRRTINPVRAVALRNNEIIVAKYVKLQTNITKMLAVIYRPFKKIKTLERLKYWYFSDSKK